MVPELLGILAPVFLCATAGFVWTRAGRPYDVPLMTSLLFTIGAPCLVFSRLVSLVVPAPQLARMALGAGAVLLGVAAVGYVVLRVAGLPRNTFLMPTVFPNAGNMGMGVCLFAFGDQGLALAVAYFSVAALGQFTVGVWGWSGRVSMRDLVETPLAWSVLAACCALGGSVTLPRWILDTTGLLGSFTIPLMLFTLGVSIGRIEVAAFGRSFGLSLLRIGLGCATGLLVASALGFEGRERGVLVVQSSMPAAVFNYLLAQRYGRSPQEVASMVMLSTLLSFATLPLLLAYLL